MGQDGVGPCRVLSPIFHKVSEMKDFEGIDFYDLDIDDEFNSELVNNYMIRSVPTIVVLDKNNEVMRKIVGAVPENQLISTLKDCMNG